MSHDGFKRVVRALRQQRGKLDSFNNSHPIGSPVRYFPVLGLSDYENTVTRSKAWSLPCGEPVVMVEGVAGCVALSNVQTVTQPKAATADAGGS